MNILFKFVVIFMSYFLCDGSNGAFFSRNDPFWKSTDYNTFKEASVSHQLIISNLSQDNLSTSITDIQKCINSIASIAGTKSGRRLDVHYVITTWDGEVAELKKLLTENKDCEVVLKSIKERYSIP
jgi:hypothetical protein